MCVCHGGEGQVGRQPMERCLLKIVQWKENTDQSQMQNQIPALPLNRCEAHLNKSE